jgi:hypothetical protein
MGARKQAHIRLCGVLVKRDSLFRRKCSCIHRPPITPITPIAPMAASAYMRRLLYRHTCLWPNGHRTPARVSLAGGHRTPARVSLAGGHRSSVELRPSRNPSLKSSETMPSWGITPHHVWALRRCAAYVATTPYFYVAKQAKW